MSLLPQVMLDLLGVQQDYQKAEIHYHRFMLEGKIPSKKDALRHSGLGKKFHYDEKVKAMLDGLQLQVQSQWRRGAIMTKDLMIVVEEFTTVSDRDNVLVVILDLLHSAGVLLHGDSTRYYNGYLIIAPAKMVTLGNEGAVVELYWRG